MVEYRVSSYPDSPAGLHYSVDYRKGSEWFIRQLFWKEEDAMKVLNDLSSLKIPVDKT